MRHISISIALLLALASNVSAQVSSDDLIGLGMAPELAEVLSSGIGTSLALPNNTYLTARNAANTADVDLIKLDGTDDLFLNSSTGNGIKFANNGTPQLVYDGANNISPVTTNVFSLGTSSLLFSNIFSNTIQIGGATSADVGSHAGYFKSDGNTVPQLALFQGTADTRAATQNFYKSRATDGSGDTIVASADKIAQFRFWGANGTSFSEAAAIDVLVDGTPGASNDMPGSIDFRLSPDGSSTVASVLLLKNDKSALFGGTIRSSSTTNIGWTRVDGTNNQACDTTCTSACAFGLSLTTDTTSPILDVVDCASSAADVCFCAGAS